MAISIGHRGWLQLIAADAGSKRKVKVVSFKGRATAGGVTHPQFNTDMQPIAVVDVTDGKLRTSEFSDTGNTMGELTQNDTGPSGHTCWALYTDTGL